MKNEKIKVLGDKFEKILLGIQKFPQCKIGHNKIVNIYNNF
jgi:hypothetical protein